MTHWIRRYPDPGAFLDRVRPWLLESEIENNLILSIAGGLIAGTQTSEGPPYLATVEAPDGEISGCVLRTPPYKPILTRLPPDAAGAVSRDLAEAYDSLPAILGPEPDARLVAEAWAEETGATARPGMEQRLYRLTEVRDGGDPPGSARWAREDDVELIWEWFRAFSRDAGAPPPPSREKAEQRVADRAVALWEDGGRVVSLAGRAGLTPHGARVGPVYTPPERRGRGYGTGVTRWLTRKLLDTGLRWCVLYADLGNPTSNRIYGRIGYEPVMDFRDYEFLGAGG